MKTLDEVLEAMIYEVSLNSKADCWEVPVNLYGVIIHYLHEYQDAKNTLHYLKEYKKKQNILKGKWQITSIKDETWGICSNCGFKQKAGELNFCPNCGADMREDIPIEYFENGGI